MRIFTVGTVLFLSFFISNVALAATSVPGGDLSGDTTWTLTGSPYVVTSDVNVPAGVTLNVEPGVIVKFTQSFATLNVLGTLNTFGNDLAPVIFTSYKDDSFGGDTNGDGLFASFPHYADWRGVIFFPGSTGNITHTGIYYAGQFFCSFTCFSFPSVRNDGGIVAFDHVGITPGAPYIDGLGVSDGSTTIVDSQVTSARSGIVVSGGSLSVHGSTVAGFNYALRNDSGVNLDATNNWWGDASGPQHVSNPSGTGARVLGDVTVLPFLSADPFATPPATSTLTPSSEAGYANDATNPTIEPNVGDASTTFTFKVVYTNSDNQAPTNVRLVIAGDNPDVPCQAIVGGGGGGFLSNLLIPTAYAAEGDGCAMDVDAAASSTLHDGNYANGEQYVIALQLPVGNFTYHFEAGDVRYPNADESSLTVSEVPAGCTVDCNSNVLFLPGLEASRLYEQEGITDCSSLPPNSTPPAECLHEKQLWLPVTDGDTEKLYLNPDGTSIRSGIYTRDTIDEIGGVAIGGNIYKTFLLDLKKWKETDHIITDYSVVPYDWRLSVDDVLTKGVKTGDNISYGGADGTYVLDELLRMASTSRTKKVTIIAHSNGGLVAKRLMLKLRELGKEDLVDKVILVAVPQIGTPKAVGGLLHGSELSFPFILDTVHARTLGENMPSAYALLPSKKYFETIDIHSIPTELITFSNSTLYTKERASYGSFVTNIGEQHGYLLGSEGRVEPADTDLDSPNVLKAGLLDQATTLHDSIDDWYPTSTTQVIQIAGWGEDTISGVSYYTEQKRDCTTVPDQYFIGSSHQECGVAYEVKKYKPNHTKEGDGTVVVPSALWMTTTTPHVERYWVDLLKYNAENIDVDHKSILEIATLVDFIKNKLTNSTSSLPTYITNATSTLSGTADVNYIYTLHSPLLLDLYDALGNHTGISTSTGRVEENIPGSRYGTFGEVKYIIANADVAQQLRLKGYATGTFSLDVEQVQGDNVLASTTFASIPVSTTTVATFSLTANGVLSPSTPLSVDTDGNGTNDLILPPQLGGVVYPDLTPPATSAPTTGTLGTNGWYTSNVLVTLTATDTGSGVASTTYSLNNGSTWLVYVTQVSITTEGTSTILYRSIDKAGNTEAIKVLSIKIDKTAPEAQISVSTTTQDILVEGADNIGTTTITKDTSGNVTIADQAGHTTKLFFTKTYGGKILTYAKLTGMQYDSQTKITLPSSSFLYVWDTKTPIVPLSQTIAVDGTYLLQASYDKKTNKTIIIILKKNLPIQTQTFTGLKIVKLTTSKGMVGYSL